MKNNFITKIENRTTFLQSCKLTVDRFEDHYSGGIHYDQMVIYTII